MTLKELLNLKLIRDNIRIRVFTPDSSGLGEFTATYNILHIYCRCPEIQDLIANKVPEEYLDYKVTEICGSEHKYKIDIIIEKV